MWVSLTSPPNLSLIGPLTTKIYYQTGITGNTDTLTESDNLPIQNIGSSKKIKGTIGKANKQENEKKKELLIKIIYNQET